MSVMAGWVSINDELISSSAIDISRVFRFSVVFLRLDSTGFTFLASATDLSIVDYLSLHLP
jgi:hypothetical protein